MGIPPARDSIDALRCRGCDLNRVSGSPRRMVRHDAGCLSCGEPVEAVLVDGDGGVSVAPERNVEGGLRG